MSETGRVRSDGGNAAGNLFLVGFLVLFLELACIRWFPVYVIFLQFFTNVVLIASFLGMSCGCLAARQRRNWLELFPIIAVAAVLAALSMSTAYHYWHGLAVDVGDQRSAQEVFFGTETRNPDVARFAIPLEAIAGFFFVVVAMMFVGLGQTLGRAFDAYPDRVGGYVLNIGGSLAGIVAFSALSWFETSPAVWFLVSGIGVAYLLRQSGGLTVVRAVSLIALVVGVGEPEWLGGSDYLKHWSPYYLVELDKSTGSIAVNAIGHQQIIPFETGGAPYSLIHLLQQHSGGPPFQDVLVIGAGSGNDVARALKFGAKRVDAVEIDPVIQDLGRRFNPDHPYQDPRVVPHIDDGRHFLRTTTQKYDLAIYALVDSLILHSSYANIRLESYLFTQQAFADAKRVLKPGGLFVTMNFFRQPWIVERVAKMAETTFGCPPVVLNLPYRETLGTDALNAFTVIIAGCNSPIPASFAQNKTFWLDLVAPRNLGFDGFTLDPATLPPDRTATLEKIAPTRLPASGAVNPATDDWPFLYLQGRLIPDFTLRAMAVMGVLGLGMVYLFLPGRRLAFDGRMFFLGAAFMLLETRAVVQMALLFGSTWVVNSSVFFTILVLILLANLFVLKTRPRRLFWHYAALLAFLAVATLVPLDVFIGGGVLWRYAVPCLLALGPVFFAGVIFAVSFHNAPQPELALGANIAGSVVGGLAEAVSMLTGFQHLLLLAAVFYLLSAWTRRAPAPALAA